jgi:hypothetical protein
VQSWFRIVKLGLDARGAVVAPKQPTFAWANTAYYARELAARHFGVSAQDMVVTAVRDPEAFPKHAVELVETDGVVEQRPLLRGAEGEIVAGVQQWLSKEIDRVIVTPSTAEKKRSKRALKRLPKPKRTRQVKP